MGWTGDSATWALSTNILKVWKKKSNNVRAECYWRGSSLIVKCDMHDNSDTGHKFATSRSQLDPLFVRPGKANNMLM